MNLQEDIRSITDLKVRPAEILSRVNKNHRPIIITQKGAARAVVQDIASYEATRKALFFLKLAAQGEAEVKHRRVIRHVDLMKRIENRLSR